MFSPESPRLSERSAANRGPAGPLPASAAPILKNKATDQRKVAPVHRQTCPSARVHPDAARRASGRVTRRTDEVLPRARCGGAASRGPGC